MLRKFCSYFSRSNVLLISCQRYAKLASQRIDADLKWYEKPGFFFHHLICTVCRRFRRQIMLIDRASRELGQSHPACCSHKLSDTRKAAIKESLAKSDS